ncbi:MAG: MotA/TolQ/ExbB proton channel family protein [Gammaproteobacteria bacterium]
MMRTRNRFAVVAVLALASLPAARAQQPEAPAADLQQLLEQTRTIGQREAQANKEREARFLAARDRQAQLLQEARAEQAEQERRQDALSAQYDANEKRLAELEEQVHARAGNLEDMFGVVRQAANDFSSVILNSLISVHYPDRGAFITEMAETKALPSIDDLERFWFEIQREMTETGRVVRFNTNVIAPDGTTGEAEVVRVGPFVATTDGEYMTYLESQKALAIMAQQPGSTFTGPAEELQEATSGHVEVALDPQRGVLLAIYAQRPNWIERIEKGEWIAVVILFVGFCGAATALYQLVYLLRVRRKVKAQLQEVDTPRTDNPVGRVLAAFKGDAETMEEDAEVIELRISEAALREVPKLERFQSFLRLVVAAGPLLGLIGTVIGMIITFQSITESGSSDPRLMADGISTAMIATVLGLGIAIPILFVNSWLAGMSRSIVQVLDEQSTGLLAESLERRRID